MPFNRSEFMLHALVVGNISFGGEWPFRKKNCDAMFSSKRKVYSPYLHELEVEQDIAYLPLVWSTWGREHPETSIVLTNMAKLAARRAGLRDPGLLLRRLRTAIGVQLARRAVRMVRACLPGQADAERLLFLD